MNHNSSILSPRSRSPLELSEILDAVFSFLGQQALHVICLVCRQWHLVALRHITPSFYWDGLQSTMGDSEYLQELEITRKRLMETRILICGRTTPGYLRVPQDRNSLVTARWKASLGLVEEIAQEGQLWVQQLTLYLDRDSWDFGTCLFPRLDDSLARGSGMSVHLTELVMETTVGHGSFPLQRILENCSRLVRLTLRTTHHAIPTWLESYRPLASREEAWGLKSLTLERLTVGGTVLQEYFPRLSNLKELRLIVLHGDPAEGNKTLILNRDTQRSFFQHLARHCPLLESLLYSAVARGAQPWHEQEGAEEEDNDADEGVLQMLFRMFPGIRSWGVPFDELTLAGIREERRVLTQFRLLAIENRVTTLEIVPGTWPFDDESLVHRSRLFDREWEARCLLDRFLCESPQLLHLKAKGVPLMCTSRRRLWACRGLKTLSVLYQDQYSTYKTPYAIYRLMGGESRLFFGSLSRMCPALEELEMEITGEVLAVRRGLCLLTRMQWLKRLTIQMNIDNWDGWDPRVNTLDEDDFSWILRFQKSSLAPSSSPLLSSAKSPQPPLSVTSASTGYFPARQLSSEEEYTNYQSQRLKACLVKIQNDDFYDCNDRKSRTVASNTGTLSPPPNLKKSPTAWEKIKRGTLSVLLQGAQPLDMIDDWREGYKRRAASTRALETTRRCLYWTDFDRQENEWPMVDGLTEDSVGSLLDVEARLLALIEGQARLEARTPEQQRVILGEKDKDKKIGEERLGGEGTVTSPVWKRSGAIGDIIVAGPWSFMDELRIEYRPKGSWSKHQVLREHIPNVQKILKQMRPDIEVHVI